MGIMVVGQSPRPDVEALIRGVVGPGTEVDLRGALDGLSRAEIDALLPRDDADTLFTRLPDGDGVRLSKAAVMRHGESRLAAMAAAGYDVVVVMCTGEFPDWMARYPVVFPSRVMAAFVEAVHPGGRLGVFTPLPEQAPKTEIRWRAAGYDPAVVALSPNAEAAQIRVAAEVMAALSPKLLVFDCISYTSAAKSAACRVIGVPGILGVTAAARVASELIG